MLRTRSLTLVVQRVCLGDEVFSRAVAFALIEYALDCLNGTGGNGQFERHVTANRCRIEAIASIYPEPGEEAREGIAADDGVGALRDRLEQARLMADFLAGGEGSGEVTTALGYSPEEAASELREKLDEALEALPA